jgi:hypothetical protein
MWAPPFSWPELGSVEISSSSVHWLLGVPISVPELEHLRVHGVSSLERELEGTDVRDLHRDSVVE